MTARLDSRELEYWGDLFVTNGLKHYMTFESFMRAPEKHYQKITGSNYRPLLPRQRLAAARIQRRFANLEIAIDGIEAPLDNPSHVQSASCCEKPKRYANE